MHYTRVLVRRLFLLISFDVAMVGAEASEELL